MWDFVFTFHLLHQKYVDHKLIHTNSISFTGPVVGIRHLQTLLIFLIITTIYLGRLNVGVSVVAMTNAESTNPDFPVSYRILFIPFDH